MKLSLKSLSLSLISSLLLASCTVNSPINTTKQFLSLWQKEQYDQAFSSVIKTVPQENNKSKLESLSAQEKETLIKNTKENRGKLIKFNVQNAVPLNADILEKLQVAEGYEVFFYTETEKEGAKNNRYYLLKINDNWRILAPSSSLNI